MQVSSIYPSNTLLPGTEFLFSELRNVSFVLLLPLLTQAECFTHSLSVPRLNPPLWILRLKSGL